MRGNFMMQAVGVNCEQSQAAEHRAYRQGYLDYGLRSEWCVSDTCVI